LSAVYEFRPKKTVVMQHYIKQLLTDIETATQNVSFPFVEKELSVHDWVSEEEENTNAPTRNLCEWSGLTPEMLPPATLLDEKEVHELLGALNQMLSAYNCHFVLQTEVPARVQYETIRQNFNQDVKVKQWHMGFFEMCMPGTPHQTCVPGEYCQCAFYADFFSDRIDEELTPDEARARELEIGSELHPEKVW
jgi:hypothetical protein